MDRQEAGEILNTSIKPDDSLFELYWYISWKPGDKDATLDGDFNAEELEAIAWWMRNTKKKGEKEDGKSDTTA